MMKRKLALLLILACLPSMARAQSAYEPIVSNSGGGGSGGSGGSTNGTITAAPRYSVAYYSLAGTTTTVAGLTIGTANYILQSNGSSSAPTFTNTPTILGTNITAIPPANISSGSLGSGVIVSSIAVAAINSSNQIVGGTIIGSNLANGTITNTQLGSGSFSNITGVGTLASLTVSGTASITTTTLNGVTYDWPGIQGGSSTFLRNNGSGGLSWVSVAVSSTSPAGASGDVQFNNAGNFAGDDTGLVWSTSNQALGVGVAIGNMLNGVIVEVSAQATDSNAFMAINSGTEDASGIIYYDAATATWQVGNNGSTSTDSSADSYYFFNYGRGATDLSIRNSDGRLHVYSTLLVGSTANRTLYYCSGGTIDGTTQALTSTTWTACTGAGGTVTTTGITFP